MKFRSDQVSHVSTWNKANCENMEATTLPGILGRRRFHQKTETAYCKCGKVHSISVHISLRALFTILYTSLASMFIRLKYNPHIPKLNYFAL